MTKNFYQTFEFSEIKITIGEIAKETNINQENNYRKNKKRGRRLK